VSKDANKAAVAILLIVLASFTHTLLSLTWGWAAMKKRPTGLLGRTQSTARRLSRKHKELVKSLSTKSAKIASYKAPPPDDSTQVSQQAQSVQPGGVL
jgi:hypothetical protein